MSKWCVVEDREDQPWPVIVSDNHDTESDAQRKCEALQKKQPDRKYRVEPQGTGYAFGFGAFPS